jgi:glycosyltransferase involved in cell wall biosynthesis
MLDLSKDIWPKISIITPSFNQGNYIEETIISVLSQNYPNLEYIIIDGGSTDNTVDIIKRYEKQLSLWISEPDKGMYFALQKGFEKSSGEIMAWINSDDKYHPGALSIIAEIFTTFNEVNWLMGNPSSFDEKGRTISVDNCREWSKYDIYTYDYKFLQQESIFWRRTLWEKAGNKIDTTVKYASDFELWLRFFRYEKLYVTQALIGGFRLRQKHQVSMDYRDQYINEIELLIKKEALSDTDKKIVARYNKIRKFVKIVSSLKFIKTNWLLFRFRRRYFRTSIIRFNRYVQLFEIENK